MPDFIQTIDAAILLWIQETLRLTVLDPVVLFFTHLGDAGFLWLALSVVMVLFPQTRKAGIAGLLALFWGLLLTNLTIKPLVVRPRPYETVLGALPLYLEHDPLSFPSGHTTAAFAAAVAWFRGLPRRWMGVTGLVLAALMGASRLYVGVHYLSDVLVGLLIGIVCGMVGWYVLQKLAAWRERKHS